MRIVILMSGEYPNGIYFINVRQANLHMNAREQAHAHSSASEGENKLEDTRFENEDIDKYLRRKYRRYIYILTHSFRTVKMENIFVGNRSLVWCPEFDEYGKKTNHRFKFYSKVCVCFSAYAAHVFESTDIEFDPRSYPATRWPINNNNTSSSKTGRRPNQPPYLTRSAYNKQINVLLKWKDWHR